MKESRIVHSCDNCGQRIAFYTPEAVEELFGSLFQEATFLRLSSLDFRNPNREVAEYWYCSDYCARDHIENRINDKEELRRRELQREQLAFSFFPRRDLKQYLAMVRRCARAIGATPRLLTNFR
jgi:hypothetical protein